MLTFFSFLLVWIGSFNWFFIAAFQYDFIAGFFGTQSSLFSRFIYFLIGMAGFVMLYLLIKNRGIFKTAVPFKKIEKAKPVEIATIVPEKDIEKEDLATKNLETEDLYKKIENLQNVSKNYQAPAKEAKSSVGFKDFDASKYDD